ncbi:MAG: amino acid adenylation domain-containing protein, partial [Opitutales bacterium]|nr:amino acid adenylation domain-containing protein [Opitutales bacterium]
VTWHLIDHQIDTGPIVKQVPVEVFEDDTVITLGLRCTEAGLGGLRQLIPDILKDEFQVLKQNAEDRTYNNRLKRETAGGVIDWSKTANDLEVEHRALRFGPIYNPIQCLKVITGGLVLIPNHVTSIASTDNQEIGTVLKITDSSITVQAKEGSLRLEKLRDIDGREIIPSQIQDQGSLKEGDRLPVLTPNEKEGVRELEDKAIPGQSFWKKRLSALIPVSFQKDLKGDAGQASDYEAQTISIDQKLLEGSISDFASPVLVAAWGAFIGRILNETEFDVELVPCTNSRHSDLEKSIFSESLPFRVSLESGELIGPMVDRISKRLNLRKKYPTITKDLLIRDPELSNARAQGELRSLPIGIVFCEGEEVFNESRYQAFLKVDSEGRIDFVWDRSVLNEQQATGLASAFETFLQRFAQEPQKLWEKLPLVAEKNVEGLLELGKGAQVEETLLAHRMFEQRASEMPDETALQHGDETLTFKELNERANILAHHLKTFGVGPEKRVGILMERSIESVISIFAILKAGGAYVPLDVTYPEERLEMMISDADLVAVLTKSDIKVAVPESTQLIPIDKCLNDDSASGNRSNLQSENKPDNLAYVIFTSGSSGKPKGVQIEHRSLSNYAWAASKEYGISKTDRVLQFASLSFDSSVEEVFCSLCMGARLVLRTDDTISSFSSFVSDCERWGITFLPLPTAFWHSLVAHWKIDSFEFPNCVKTVVLGGEAMSASHLSTWLDLVGNKVRLINSYGPTEVTVVATTFDVTDFDKTADDTRIPIGQPLSGYETYVLDRNLSLVPPGVEGELCVGGVGLARGYLNQPEETHDKFINFPYHGGQSSRLYRTGDSVVQLSCSTLIYQGRIDEQLKVRGFRLEPKEIEEK